jgi:thiol-disulfide isomerase/thioredoxin
MTEPTGFTRRQWALAFVVGAAAAGAGAGAWWARRRDASPAAPQGAAPPGAAPVAGAFAGDGPLPQPLQTVDGRTLTNADVAGRFVLLNFWAPWCPPCLKEMPEIDRFARSEAGRDTLVIGLAVDERANVDRYLADHPVGFPIVVVGYPGLAWVRRLGNDASALPFSAVYDRSQKLVQRKFGPTSEAELSGWTKQL